MIGSVHGKSLPPYDVRMLMPTPHVEREMDESAEPGGYYPQDMQIRIRGYKTESDCLNPPHTLYGSIHPEGGLVYNSKQLVSDCPISSNLRGIGDQIVSRCSIMGQHDVTVFLRRKGAIVEYYVADHLDESILWINAQRPDGLQGLTESRVRNTLCEEYWAHVEAFPGVRPVSAKSLYRLKDVLSSLAVGMLLTSKTSGLSSTNIDASTSDGSTSPFGCEQIKNFLGLLNSFSENHIDEYQTYAVGKRFSKQSSSVAKRRVC